MTRWSTPLWWAEVNAGRFALGLVALLAAGTAATAAVVPAKVAHADQWVSDNAVGHSGYVQRDMIQRENANAGSVASSNTELDDRGAQALASMPEPIRRIVSETDVSVLGDFLLPTGDADPATNELPPFYRLADVVDFQEKVTFVAGAPPTVPPGTSGPDQTIVPVALGRDVANRFHLSVGSTITGSPRFVKGKPLVLSVTGIFVPGGVRGEADPAWNVADRVFHPERTVICPNGTFNCDSPSPSWLADALVPDAGSIARLTATTTTWDHVVEPTRVRSADLTAISGAVQQVQQGRVSLGGEAGGLSTGMLTLIAQIRDTQRAGHLVAAVVLGGAAAGGLAALVLVLGMAIGRRSGEIALMKARGGGPGRLAVRVAAQVAGVALLAGLAGAALGASAGGGSLSSVRTWYGAIGVPVAAFAVVARLVWRHTDHVVVRRGGETGDAVTRKVVRDVGVVLAAGGAVAVYRFGGGGGAGTGSIDPLAVAAPALTALAAGVLAVRLMPALLNPVARIAGHGRGAVGFVGAALAGRRVRAVAAPLVGLVVVVAAGMFAAGYDASVATKVRVDAFDTVGAGARVVAGSRLGADEKEDPTGTAVADGFVAKAAALPGARHATGSWLGTATLDAGGDPGRRVEVVVVDADSFRAVAADTAAALPGQFRTLPGSWPVASGSTGPAASSAASSPPALPASVLASPGVPCSAGSVSTMQVGGYVFAVRCDGTAEVPMALSEQDRYAAGGGYLIVSRAQLKDAVTAAGTATPIETMTRANTVWISGEVTGSALRALPGVTADYRIDLVQDVRAAKFAAGQTKSARDVFHLVEALCAGYFALCLVLLLAATGRVSRDSALLMQVFGLRPGRGRLVSVLVPAPIAAVALAAGVGMGLGLAPLLGPLTRSAAGVAGSSAASAAAAGGSVLATSSIGLGWAVPAAAAAVVLAAAGIVADLLLWRDRELSVRLRSSTYE